VDVLIDRRELLEKARERGLTLPMVEKDYVLGWMLYGLSEIPGLIFKGGTALSKVYFPKIWRLSEDLDFVFGGDFGAISSSLNDAFERAKKNSGIRFILKSAFSNPGYLQLKVQYDALLGKNWLKLDVTKEVPVDAVAGRKLEQIYSDYPPFKVKVESVEEIGAQKLRALIERKKSRDFFDAWQLLHLDVKRAKLKRLFLEKCKYKGIEFRDIQQIFPPDIEDVLAGYWERELGRLVNPVPSLDLVLRELRGMLAFLGQQL
jgi:predicted nucleotidyltransferase component of viral defense system